MRVQEASSRLEATLAELKKEYVVQLSSKLTDIESLTKRYEIEALLKLTKIAHRLAGSGKTFDFPELSQAGQLLEVVLLDAVSEIDQKMLSPATRKKLDEATIILAEACKKSLEKNYGPIEGAATIISIAARRETILIIEKPGQEKVLAPLDEQLAYFGYHYRKTNALGHLEKTIKDASCDLIIIQTDFSEEDKTNIKAYLDSIGQDEKIPPIVYIAERDDFESRLAAVHLKGTAFSSAPLDFSLLIDRLNLLLEQRRFTHRHVLIIDDDEVLATRYSIALESVGMIVTVLSDPSRIIEVLRQSTIDLVLLDFNMPKCNGFELASILRQLDLYETLPIVFLSTEIYLDQFMRDTRLGIDDFLTKPILTEHLVSVVTERVARSATLRRFMNNDSATGLLNHTSLEKELSLEISRSRRTKTEFTYVMIDIDHFKQVNDSFGHAAGDLVLRTLAHLLRQRLRATDQIGRYGGEEFGIILPGTGTEQALKVMEEIHRKFAEFAFPASGRSFHVTFSGGLAAFSDFPNALKLNHAADKALYQAKHAGRNCLTIAKKN